jgi:hypothetical protein
LLPYGLLKIETTRLAGPAENKNRPDSRSIA